LKILTIFKEGNGYTKKCVDVFKRRCAKYAPDVPVEVIDSFELDVPGHWSKIEAFKHKGAVLYIDLSCVPFGDLSCLIKAAKKYKFIGIHDFNPHIRNLGSGVMSWRGDMNCLFEKFKEDPEGHIKENSNPRYWGDQGFIERNLKNYRYWQKVCPGAVVSYKKQGIKPNAKIVCFHGKPKPWEVLDDYKR